MENLTIVIPFFNGHGYIHKLLEDIPSNIPVIIVDDHSDKRLQLNRENTVIVRPEKKGYFSGAVNRGIELTRNDVLVLNQDVRLRGLEWLQVLTANRDRFALIGERIKGNHPAFPNGYVHGVFQFMRRDAIDAVGGLDEVNYPLWGGSALWQWQICRKGFEALPLPEIPGMEHHHHNPSVGKRYGDSITQILQREGDLRTWFIRTPPAISVIVPCYNYGKFLPDCLNSLLGGLTCLGEHPGQTFASFEVIIVDDGSIDKTPEIVIPYVDGWNGVRYIRQENKGLPSALNTGINAALGKYISVLSADDMREPWSLQDLYSASVANPGSVIYDNPTEFRNGSRISEWELPQYDFEKLLQRNLMHAGIMYPKTAWEKVGGYNEKMKHGREDWCFNVALGRDGFCGIKIPRSGYLYRREGHNRSQGNAGTEWRQYFVVQMHNTFPDLYSGVRPMNCCGGGKVSIQTRTGTRNMKPILGDGNMVLIEYVGTAIGSTTWGGPGTLPSGRYYRFGRNIRDKVKYVEEQDVPWFESQREAGKKLFIRGETPKLKPTEGTVDLTGTVTATVVPKKEAAVLTEGPDPEPVEEAFISKDEVPEVALSVDPNTLTVAQIKALTLSPAEWGLLAKAEEEGKFRYTVMDWAEAKAGGK